MGDFGTDAHRFIDWLARAGQSLWQVLPVNPTDEYGSPYAGLSAFAGNVSLLGDDPETVLARSVSLSDESGYVCFCRDNAEWLKPYTAEVLASLGAAKVRRVDVVCPGFVSDCLETLEEIGMEVRDTFVKAGGGEFHAIPCLNEHPRWIAALSDLAWRNLAGWLTPPPEPKEREMALARAKAMGAKG